MRDARTTAGGTPRWIWALPCIVLLIYGAAWRWTTLEPPGISASRGLAYSDVVVFYEAENAVPYLDRDIEYPVLTGLTIWLAGFAPGGRTGYFLANAVVLSAALLGCLVFLARLGPEVRLSRFALAPGLALYGVLNWDALGVLGLVAAMFYARRRQLAWSGASLALGTSAKLFPAFVLPVLWAHTAQQHHVALELGNEAISLRSLFSSNCRQLLTAFAAVTLALNLPLALLDFSGWSYFLRFQAGRTHNLDSIWHFLPTIPDQAESLIFALVFLGGVAWLTLRVLDGARWEIAALLSLVFFLLPTKVYSPQYDLWLLPMLALTACPIALGVLFVLADVFYYWAIFTFHFVATGGESWIDINAVTICLGAAVWVREIALASLLTWGLMNLGEKIDSADA